MKDLVSKTIDDILQNKRGQYLEQWVVLGEKGEILSSNKNQELAIKKAKEIYHGWMGLLYVEEKDEIICSDLFD